MDQESRDELNRIIALGADSLTSDEVNFLYARRSYLNKTQREEFADIIKKKDEQVKEDQNRVEEESNPKQKKDEKKKENEKKA